MNNRVNNVSTKNALLNSFTTTETFHILLHSHKNLKRVMCSFAILFLFLNQGLNRVSGDASDIVL